MTVVVETANQPPVVNAGADLPSPRPRSRSTRPSPTTACRSGATVVPSGAQVSGPAPARLLEHQHRRHHRDRSTAEGAYVLRLTATDTSLGAFDEVRSTVAPREPGARRERRRRPHADATASSAHVDRHGDDDGAPVPSTVLSAGVERCISGPGSVTFAHARPLPDHAATFTNPGAYVVRLGATDGEANAFDDATVVVQPASPTGAPPTAALTSPLAGTRITGPVDVVGSALSDSLASWHLEHRLKGDGPWTRFASGTTQVTNGVLGSSDATLLMNGITEVRLTVTDTAGRFASADHAGGGEGAAEGRRPSRSRSWTWRCPCPACRSGVTRSYDSRDKRVGDFGHGWRLELSDVRVEESETAGLAWQATVSPGFFPTYCLAHRPGRRW